MRLIDADKADVDQISCYYGDRAYLDDVQEWLDEQETVDLVRHGEWEPVKDELRVRCSCCKSKNDTLFGSHLNYYKFFNYCPDCGAKMDLTEE